MQHFILIFKKKVHKLNDFIINRKVGNGTSIDIFPYVL